MQSQQQASRNTARKGAEDRQAKIINYRRKQQPQLSLCSGTETYEIVPARKISDTDRYFSDPKVIEAIERGKADAKAGRVTRITDPADPWATIL